MKIGIIIQARMKSSRLPGKVLMKLPIQSEFTVLDQIIKRIADDFDYCIGTSTNHTDDIISNTYDRVYRGSEDDVLSRFYEIASLKNYDHIVRLTGDNPCIDSKSLRDTVEYHLKSNSDYTMSSGLPLGCNFEIFSYKTLEYTFRNATSLAEKEHVTLYMKNNSSTMSISNKNFDTFSEILDVRLTLDYPSDYALLNLLFSKLPMGFSLIELSRYIKKNEWVRDINCHNKQRVVLSPILKL